VKRLPTPGSIKRSERRAARKAEQARIEAERGGFSRARSPKPLPRERGFVGEYRRIETLFQRAPRYRCRKCRTLVEERDRPAHFGRCSSAVVAKSFARVD
jgi:hypothetical protein